MQPTINLHELLRIAVEGGYYVLLLIFVIQTVFLGYHWFTFGSSRRISMIALSVYLLGGAILLITYSLALNAV